MARLTARGLLALLALGTAVIMMAAARREVGRVSLADIGPRYGLSPGWSEAGSEFRLRSNWTTLAFTVGSREAEWNGYRLFLGEAVTMKQHVPFIAVTDWLAIVRPLLDSSAVPSPGGLDLVVIDPGHGSPDPGTENRALKLQEKNVTLDVARRLQRDLVARGYRVLLTRNTDAKLRPRQLDDLHRRAAKANQAGADLFISLHFNSLPETPAVSGIETYALTPAGQRSTASSQYRPDEAVAVPGNQHDHWNMVLCAALHRALLGRLPATDRGLKHARFAVLRTLRCPAVLVEAGFLSNPAEARRIKTAVYRQRIAEAIGAGVRDYDTRLRLANSSTE